MNFRFSVNCGTVQRVRARSPLQVYRRFAFLFFRFFSLNQKWRNRLKSNSSSLLWNRKWPVIQDWSGHRATFDFTIFHMKFEWVRIKSQNLVAEIPCLLQTRHQYKTGCRSFQASVSHRKCFTSIGSPSKQKKENSPNPIVVHYNAQRLGWNHIEFMIAKIWQKSAP